MKSVFLNVIFILCYYWSGLRERLWAMGRFQGSRIGGELSNYQNIPKAKDTNNSI